MSSNTTPKRGLDVTLTRHGKRIKMGESVTFRLVKGPASSVNTADPVDAAAPAESFPLLAKFSDSVVTPLLHGAWQQSRLYQQDVPKPEADSDEDAEAQALQQQKRWRYKKTIIPKRQWIWQQQQDFLETMLAKRQRKTIDRTKLSSRYEGLPEHNSSRYAVVSLRRPRRDDDDDDDDDVDDDDNVPEVAVQMLPASNCTVNFAQPAARKTYSLSEAEQVLQEQRAGVSIQTMHHRGDGNTATRTGINNNNNGDANATNNMNGGMMMMMKQLRGVAKKPQGSKSRLFSKLLTKKSKDGDDDDDGDDVMGDVTFRNRKGGGRARTELLNTLGDGVKVSDDGVLGGTNDSAFARGQRFGNFQANAKKNANNNNKNAKTERGADGAAMADDFYQRDVQAEYDELDYDANEQFDDDDVDLGEAEVVVSGAGGYGGDDIFDNDNDSDDSNASDGEDQAVTGAAGLATAAGFRQLLAKARGEIPNVPVVAEEDAKSADADANAKNSNSNNNGNASNGNSNNGGSNANSNGNDSNNNNGAAMGANGSGGTGGIGGGDTKEELDHIAKIKAAAEKSRLAAEGKAAAGAGGSAGAAPAAAIETDANGLRVISLQSVRREIWLNHGQIPTKRLMKIFSVGKKSADSRQSKFREVIKELCTMKNDPVSGRMLVLKQHYSNM